MSDNNILEIILAEIKSINTRITNLEEGQKRIETKLDSIENQTATLTEFKTEVNIKLDDIKKDLSTMEIVTSSNYLDIAKLKAVK